MIRPSLLKRSTVLKRLIQTISVLSVAALASMGLAVFTPTEAKAATCYYNTCYNLDPASSGCSADAHTVGYDGGVEFRWSPSCKAGWLRDTNGFSWVSTLTQYTYDHSGDGTIITQRWAVDIPWPGYSGTYTKMIPWGYGQWSRAHMNNYWSGYFDTTY
jgi:hypothetical protein